MTNRVSWYASVSSVQRIRKQFPPSPSIGTAIPISPKEIVGIEILASHNDLLEALKSGKTVRAYRSFFKPQVEGSIYERRYGTDSHNGKISLPVDNLSTAIELIRQEEFPHLPDRRNCVFATATPVDARRFHGNVYEIELILKPEAKSSATLPISWHNRSHFEKLGNISMNEFHPRLCVDYFGDEIRKYLTPTESPPTQSDILIDPSFVEIRVIRRYVPNEEETIRDRIEEIFTNDQASNRGIPDSMEKLLDAMRWDVDAPYYHKLKKLATTRLIQDLLKLLPAVIKPDFWLSYRGCSEVLNISVNQIIITDNGLTEHFISRLEECLSAENNPYSGNEHEYKEALSKLEKVKSLLQKTGYLYFENTLIALPDQEYLPRLKTYLAAEEQYLSACKVSGIKIDELKLGYRRKSYINRAIISFRFDSPGSSEHKMALEVLNYFKISLNGIETYNPASIQTALPDLSSQLISDSSKSSKTEEKHSIRGTLGPENGPKKQISEAEKAKQRRQLGLDSASYPPEALTPYFLKYLNEQAQKLGL